MDTEQHYYYGKTANVVIHSRMETNHIKTTTIREVDSDQPNACYTKQTENNISHLSNSIRT